MSTGGAPGSDYMVTMGYWTDEMEARGEAPDVFFIHVPVPRSAQQAGWDAVGALVQEAIYDLLWALCDKYKLDGTADGVPNTRPTWANQAVQAVRAMGGFSLYDLPAGKGIPWDDLFWSCEPAPSSVNLGEAT